MPIEIEKKYRLTAAERTRVVQTLKASPAVFVSEDFEENALYSGDGLDPRNSVLRIRRTRLGAFITFKSGLETKSEIKHRLEEESAIENADAVGNILEAIGFKQNLVYEKRRLTWKLDSVEVVIDELPFGDFMEIEGPIEGILRAERTLGIQDLVVEHSSYPQLTKAHGLQIEDRTEARFNAER